MVAAAAMQCLSAFAERVVAADDGATAAVLLRPLLAVIAGPEPGWQY
eukprot:SAG22_NODE_6237_length_882_cov_0.987229_2_plen_46_part_01